jgi:hypothetical protein
MVKVTCDTVDEKRKVSVQDGDSLIYAIEAPISGKASELKVDIALLFHAMNELRKRQAKVDKAIIAKLKKMGAYNK